MLVKQEQISPCEVELQIQVDAEKVDAAVDNTYAELGKVTNVPGFRKGKAPRVVLERVLDEERVKDRVADKLLKSAYIEALEESKLEPYAPADVDIEKFELGEPLLFKAIVPLAPKVELGEYTGLEEERKVQPVTDKDVDEEINRLLERNAQFPEIHDREAQEGDVVRIETKPEDDPEAQPKPHVVQIGDSLPDFDKGLVGMNPDDEKVIDVNYPNDYEVEEMRGKSVQMHVKLCEIHEKKLPELTDEWVKETFSGEAAEGTEPDAEAVDTVDKLKAKMKSLMEQSMVQAADNEVRNKIVDKVIENAKVDFPNVMVENAIDEHLESLVENLKKRKLTLDDYLKYQNITIEDLRAQYAEEARRDLRSSLVLGEILEKEDIKVEDEDVKSEIQIMADENKVPAETIQAYIDRTNGMPGVRNRILSKKVVDFLVHASNIKNVG